MSLEAWFEKSLIQNQQPHSDLEINTPLQNPKSAPHRRASHRDTVTRGQINSHPDLLMKKSTGLTQNCTFSSEHPTTQSSTVQERVFKSVLPIQLVTSTAPRHEHIALFLLRSQHRQYRIFKYFKTLLGKKIKHSKAQLEKASNNIFHHSRIFISWKFGTGCLGAESLPPR